MAELGIVVPEELFGAGFEHAARNSDANPTSTQKSGHLEERDEPNREEGLHSTGSGRPPAA